MPSHGSYFTSLAELKSSPTGSSDGVEQLEALRAEMDLSKARKLAWDGSVEFWVVIDDEDVCLVAEMAVPADPSPEGGRIYEPVSLGPGTTLAARCAPTEEFEAQGLALEAASAASSLNVKLMADGQVPDSGAWPKIASNLFGTVSH